MPAAKLRKVHRDLHDKKREDEKSCGQMAAA